MDKYLNIIKNKFHKNKVSSRNQYSEVLLDNILDYDFQTFLKPLNFFQNLWLYPKYKIRDNFITPNGWKANALSVIITCFITTCYFIRIETATVLLHYQIYSPLKINTIYFFCTLLSFIIFAIGFFVNLITNICNSNTNIDLILKLQKIFKIVGRNDKSKTNLKALALLNCIYGFLMTVGMFSCLSVFHVYLHNKNPIDYFNDFMIISFDMNMLYAGQLMIVIKDNTRYWICKMQSCDQLVGREKELFLKGMYGAYVDLLDSYRLHIRVFQNFVSIRYLPKPPLYRF